MIPGGVNELLLRSAAAGGATAGRSVRFNSADSAYMSRQFSASSTDRTRGSISFWVKINRTNGGDHIIYSTDGSATYAFALQFDNGNLKWTFGGSANNRIYTTQVFRDCSAWYHFLATWNTNESTASDRLKLYVNGTQITTFSETGYPSSGTSCQFPNNNVNYIGTLNTSTDVWNLRGYLALVHFIDGQALTPSSFGETSATTGQWIAKTYSGSYGTNGFFLDFLDNSGATSTTLGKDAAGSNNWTPNNLSVTAGSGNDSLRDHPTSAGTSTGVGGEVSGNYCTLNPLAISSVAASISDGNLKSTGTSATYGGNVHGTIPFSSGKWYIEATPQSVNPGANSPRYGIIPASLATISLGNFDGPFYISNGNKLVPGTGITSYGASFAANDIIGIAVDADNGAIYFSKNGTWQNSGVPTSGSSKTGAAYTWTPDSTAYVYSLSEYNGTNSYHNFGQRAFAYTAPSGFSPLVDTLLTPPTIAKPNTVFDVIRYTGTGSNATIPNANTVPTSIAFAPDVVWIKCRSAGQSHRIVDAVRGATYEIYPNLTNAEDVDSQGVTAFNSDGFSLGTSSTYNGSGNTYVAWTWDAGSSNAPNSSGTIASTVRANISAGFSVVTYTGVGYSNVDDNFTVGHGLGVKPAMIIIKKRSATGFWAVWHTAFGDPAASGTNDKYIILNSTGAQGSLGAGYLYKNASTSSVFGIGVGGEVNGSGSTFVAYCWAPVAGYSAFGSYTGNGSTDGPFVYTGFRPRWVMVKNASAADSWSIIDTARNTFNLANSFLLADSSGAEVTPGYFRDYLSNGFKIRDNGSGVNTNGNTYIYAAFAESPFSYARAR